MARMHVLHVAQPRVAGVPKVVAALAADQVARGWDVTVACPVESHLRADALAAGARWEAWEATRSPGPSTLPETRRLAAVVRRAAPDVVHLHSSKAGLCGRLALRGRRPTIFQPHDWSFDLASGPTARAALAWERAGARWAHAVVCVSEGERERGEAAGIRARWRLVPNGVDLDRYAPLPREAARRELGLPPDAPLAVIVGRICRQKGQDHMLRVWPEVRRRVPEARLVLVGDPDGSIPPVEPADDVVLAGWQEDPRPWLAAANVVVLPSRSEAGSLVAMEALAMGRSLVASDVSGIRAGLEVDAGAGAVVPVGAREQLVEAVAARLADPGLADREGVAGRRRVEERFSLRAASERMASLYAETLNAERARRSLFA